MVAVAAGEAEVLPLLVDGGEYRGGQWRRSRW